MIRQLCFVSVLVCAGVCSLESNAFGDRLSQLQTVVLSDDMLPNRPRSTVGSVSRYVLNNAGQVAFVADGGFTIALASSPFADLSTTSSPSGMVENMFLADDGSTVFEGISGDLRARRAYHSRNGATRQIAGPNLPARGFVGEPLDDLRQSSANIRSVSPAGHYALDVSVENSRGVVEFADFYQGIENESRIGMRRGTPAPGFDEARFVDSTAFSIPIINSNNTMLFGGKATGGDVIEDNNDIGLWASKDGVLELLYRTGQPVPGGSNGEVFRVLPNHSDLFQPSINNNDDFAFISVVANDSGESGWSILANRHGRLDEIMHQGDIAPGTDLPFFVMGLGDVAINSSGQVAFRGFAGGLNAGFWVESNDGELELAAFAGQEVEGVGALRIDRDHPFQLNGLGQVAFRSTFQSEAGNGNGVFVFDTDGELKPVLIAGDMLTLAEDDIRKVESVHFLAENGGNQDGLKSSMNEFGQILVEARFDNGSSGLFVSNLVAIPEPVFSLEFTVLLFAIVARMTFRIRSQRRP